MTIKEPSAEYKNDYLAVSLRPFDDKGRTLLCCFSVNLRRFDLIRFYPRPTALSKIA